jgi:hypothetical protein
VTSRRPTKPAKSVGCLSPLLTLKVPDALNAVLRAPVVTSDSLAKALHVTPRGARLLQQLLIAPGFRPGSDWSRLVAGIRTTFLG